MGLLDSLLPDKRVKEMVARKDVDSIIDYLNSPSLTIRAEAAIALGNMGDSRAVEPLINHMYDNESPMRWHAAEALGKLGDPKAIPVLLKALYDKDKFVQQKADNAIWKINRRGLYQLILAFSNQDQNVVVSAYNYVKAYGDQAVEPLIEALKNSNNEVRINASLLLGELKDIRSVEPMIESLKDPSPKVRINAIRALERLGDIRATEPLVRTLKDEDSTVRNTAAIALKKLNVKMIPKENEVVKEKETIYNIVKIPCKYCGTLIENTSPYCSSCGAPLNPFK